MHRVDLLTDWKLTEDDLSAIDHLIYERYKEQGRRFAVLIDTGKTVEVDSFRPIDVKKYVEEA